MRFKNCLLVILVSVLFLPELVSATQAGFVPSNGIWFSRTELLPQESVRIYTVVINNNYYALNGLVVFYDNDDVIDSVEVTLLKKGEARQLSVFWQPTAGDHRVSARFTKAEAIDDKGRKTVLSLDAINDATGRPLILKNGEVSDVWSAALSVEQNDDKLIITAQKVATTTNEYATGTSEGIPGSSAADLLTKNKAFLGKAEAVAQTITSTADKIENTYQSVKSAINRGSAWYGSGKETFIKIQPFFKQIYYGWLVVSDNNDPVRIIIIVVLTILVWYVVRRLRRRHRYYDNM